MSDFFYRVKTFFSEKARAFIKFFRDPAVRREYLKYFAVGAATTVIDFAAMAVIIFAAKPESFGNNILNAVFNVPKDPPLAPAAFTVVLATGVGFLLSFVFNYLMSVFFVYKYGAIGWSKRGFAKFAIFAFAALLISIGVEYIGYDLLGVNLWLVKIFISIMIFLFNYFTRKKYIFNIELIIDEEKTIRM
ncbi:MAG: GtrA family protein [Clostridiales bacterium]|jgi:putative flippase GtrA|nr:GtrA family protein [Clostridiales bacterium]